MFSLSQTLFGPAVIVIRKSLSSGVVDNQQSDAMVDVAKSVSIGMGAQEKHAFRAGQTISGAAVPVADERLEPAEFYRASRLKILEKIAARFKRWPAQARQPAGSRHVPRAWPPAAGRTHLQLQVPLLHLGLPHGCGDDHRPVEPGPETLSHGNLLLWA